MSSVPESHPGRPRRAFGIVSKVVLQERGLPLGSKALYALLCAYADDDGACFPSNETLAADLAVSESSVIRGLRTLREWGVIDREERFVDNRQTTSVTRLTDVVGWGGVTPRPVTGDTQEGVSDATPGGVTGDHQNNTTTTNTTKNTPSPDGEDGGFERWWKHYPRKQGKGDAVKAFKTALKKAPLAEIGQGLMNARRYWEQTGTPMDKIPYPATWLNREQWGDEYPPVASAAGVPNGEDPNSWMHRTPENTP